MLKEIHNGEHQLSVMDLRSEIRDRYTPKKAPKIPAQKISAKEKAERARAAKAQKEREARWARERAQGKEERRINALAEPRVYREVWPRLQLLPAAKLAAFLSDSEIRGRRYQVREAMAAIKAKPSRAQRMAFAALLALRSVFSFSFHPPKEAAALLKACKVDPARIRRTVEAEEKAKAMAAAKKSRDQAAAAARKPTAPSAKPAKGKKPAKTKAKESGRRGMIRS